MRPPILTPLFASAAGLKGIGEKLDKLLAKLMRGASFQHTRVVDLLFHLPSQMIDRSFRPKINMLPQSGTVTLEVTVGQHKAPPRTQKRLPYRVEVYDDTGSLTLIFFHSFTDHLKRTLPMGETRYVSGDISWYGTEPQIAHPDYVLAGEAFEKMPLLEPIYPLTAGLSSRILGRAIQQALTHVPDLPEWQDEGFRAKNGWPSFGAALIAQHCPENFQTLSPDHPTRQRLAYDELLANQLALGLVRRRMKRASGFRLAGTGAMRQAILAALPYQLTAAQERAILTILQDMAAPERMLRLLQGDVGAGKTIVALLALATAVESGKQAAFMVPTEILARQHLASLTPLCLAANIRLKLLTGREKGKQREVILQELRDGQIDILIGTHALFQEDVLFASLGLAVIDEQHRFGVHQRLHLQTKGEAVDLLVMTATPIPRTLALTVYGDMDVSKLDEKPPSRQAIDTRVLPMSRVDEVVAGLARSIAQQQRIYWVCPLVAESELIDLTAVEDRYAKLKQYFGDRVGLVHGQMKGPARDQVMADFKAGILDILVATTVIEVGVDVPEASIMVIENAERFGLAQLHQLRGRVGRGLKKSSCLLLYQEPLGEVARARLKIMRETEDGFRIAEEDLKLRGAGEVLGTQQSGIALFKMANLSVHGELLAAARDDTILILQKDPNLTSPRGQALRCLLYLFEREEATRLLAAG